MATFKIIETEAAIMKLAKEAAKDTETAATKIHQALVSALAHTAKHGNAVVVDHVYATLHQALNHRGIGVFIRRFSNLRPSENDKGETIWRKPGKKPMTFQQDEAIANPYWTLTAVRNANKPLWDADGRFAGFIGQLRYHIGYGDAKEKKAATELLKVLVPIATARELDLSKQPSIADGKAARPQAKDGDKNPANANEKANEPQQDAA